MNPIVVEFDNRLAEHLAAERLYYRSTPWWKADKVVAGALAFGIFSVLTAGAHWWSAIPFPLALMEWFNLLSLRPLQVRYLFKRNPKFLEVYRLSFSDDGIHFNTASLDSHIAWTHFTRVLENERVVLLIYGTRMYSVIPTRAFVDPSQRTAFMTLVRRHIPAAATDGG